MSSSFLTHVAVTGATGFIGSRLVRDLLQRGNYAVRACVRSPQYGELLQQHLAASAPNAASRLSIHLLPSLVESDHAPVFQGCQAVFHLATPLQFDTKNPEQDIMRPALEGTLNVLRGALKAGVKRVIFTSTMVRLARLVHLSVGADTVVRPPSAVRSGRRTQNISGAKLVRDLLSFKNFRLSSFFRCCFFSS
jgi:nucleoside-diphosphate-sugar epimerase